MGQKAAEYVRRGSLIKAQNYHSNWNNYLNNNSNIKNNSKNLSM